MDDKTKEEFILLFNQGFEELVLPALEEIREEMTTKDDLKKLENKLEHRMDNMENSLDRIETKLDKVAEKVTDDDIKISKLERKVSSLPSH